MALTFSVSEEGQYVEMKEAEKEVFLAHTNGTLDPLGVYAKGAYGTVFMARVDTFPSLRAVKRIDLPDLDTVGLRRIGRELGFLKHLPDHKNVCKFYESLVSEKFVHFVFEPCPTTLHDLNFLRTGYVIRDVKQIMTDILEGVAHLHSYGCIHRDLKPSNVLIDLNGNAKLCDLGLACLESFHSVQSPGLDEPAVVKETHVVTRWYRAPEIEMFQEYDQAVDMWSVGCMFAELLRMTLDDVDKAKRQYDPLFVKSRQSLQSHFEDMPYDEVDFESTHFYNIVRILGNPGPYESMQRTTANQIKAIAHWTALPVTGRKCLCELFVDRGPFVPPEALDLLQGLLLFDPSIRFTVNDALVSPFIQSTPPARATLNERAIAYLKSLEEPTGRKRSFATLFACSERARLMTLILDEVTA